MKNGADDSRRRFLRGSAGVVGSLYVATLPVEAQNRLFPSRTRKKGADTQPAYVYIGTDSAKPGAKGIYVARFDADSGQLSAPVLAAATSRPSFLALNAVRGRKILYAVNEGGAHDSGVTAFQVDAATGMLRQLGKVSSGGAGPCYLSVDATGSSAYVANYNGGTVASYKVQADGTLSPPVSRVDFHDAAFGSTGPMKQRQDGPHPHSARLSPTNRFLVVNDLGLDALVTFPVDTSTGRLGTPHVTETKPGSGPRHLAFHPNGRWVYVVDELSNRVDQYLWNMVHGGPGQVLAAQALLTSTGHSVSTLEPGATGTSTAGEILIGPDGTTLYVSNRLAENSIVLFRIDEATGTLTQEQRINCGGKTPRQFTLDPSGRWLLCGNQDSNSVTVFRRDQGTGRLSGPVQTLPIMAPMMTLFV